jgi:hypothetical protein
MSPHLHNEIARARQQEIAGRTNNADHYHATRPSVTRRRGAKHRLAQVLAALGVCAAAGTAVGVSDAYSHQTPVKQQIVHVSPQQLAGEIRALEAKGFLPAACTVSGTLMRDYSTGQSVLIEWQSVVRHLAR